MINLSYTLSFVILISFYPLFIHSFCRIVSSPHVNEHHYPNNAANIRILGPLGWIEGDYSRIELTISSGVALNRDFYILRTDQYVIPSTYLYEEERVQVLSLVLYPGKTWIPDLEKHSSHPEIHSHSNSNNSLYLNSIRCKDASESHNFEAVLIAKIHKSKMRCPHIPTLPNSDKHFMDKISDILKNCQHPRVIQSKHLHWRKFNSLALLQIQPPVIFVDGSDQGFWHAATSVDKFIAAHAVLEVAWEPMNPREPLWWILMPRPWGMPGHFFAILDQLQWKHPYVAHSERFKENVGCNRSITGCVPGCNYTLIKTMTASGYSADIFNTLYSFPRTMLDNVPLQIGPVMLHEYDRYSPPWNKVDGWTYTFQGCHTNFIDCFFLDHSPCPHISFDVRMPGKAFINQSRLTPVSGDREYPMRPEWWPKAVGRPSDKVPERSIKDLTHAAWPSGQAIYNYFFRPNYKLRHEVYTRINKLNLQFDSCAVVHVRRGDILFHHLQGRSYIPMHAYARAARPMLNAMKINDILILTDSQAAIEEALKCESEYPEVCQGLRWHFLEKHRWKAGEGGWENPFPSGNVTEEFINIQMEFALAQKCDLFIKGDSGFADKVYKHMCCGFPLGRRGKLPHRCVCPPGIRIEQGLFDCKAGNQLECDHDKPFATREARTQAEIKFSFSPAAFRNVTQIFLRYSDDEGGFDIADEKQLARYKVATKEAVKEVCKPVDDGPVRIPHVCNVITH